jgi:DNA-binding CsgD family transcriptional regulator
MGVTRAGFLGRTSERDRLDRLLEDVRGGQSAVLVVRGEAGVGKTALLRLAARQASEFDVVRIAGVEAEMELPFAGVHQLCASMLAHIDALPEPQRQALRVALGRAAGEPPDRFLVALAVLGVLSAAAEDRPLLCLVDDAQWLDGASGQVLGFVGRRLLAESVAIVIAVREPDARHAFRGLPELPLEGLDEADARALLARAVAGRLDDDVRDRIVAETRGNPLALLELLRTMSGAELAAGFGLPAAGDLPRHLEARYLQRVDALPDATRHLVLLAAADSLGDATLFWRAAQRLELDPAALAPAEEADLLEVGTRVRFRHGLVRAAVYRAASPGDRQRVHRALAEETDGALDADRRAWHRASAAAGADEDVAAELERSAGLAQTRGGLAAAAALLERAAALTADPADRAHRALAAAQATHQAGAPEDALALLATAEAGPPDPLMAAREELLRAQIAFTSHRGTDAPPLLLEAARKLEPLDVALARETYLEALMAVQFAGRHADGAGREVAAAARAAPASPAPRAPDLLLDGLAVLLTEGHAAGAPPLKRALRAFRDGDAGFRWLPLARAAAIELWDHETWSELAAREVQLARDAGALTALPLALTASLVARIVAGDLAAAASAIDEVRVATRAAGTELAPFGSLVLAAWRGRESDLATLEGATAKGAEHGGGGLSLNTAHWATALLDNGLGEYELALAAAQQVPEPAQRLDPTYNWVLPELVEAAVRSGETKLAREALGQLSERARAAGADWGLGLEARSRALLSHREAAERRYREAIERLGRTRLRGEHARARLLYGEWLRREGRRIDAREQLRAAHRAFTGIGCEAFAERARRELVATGGTVRRRRSETRDELTAQEWQIARLARQGLSNPEIGARLFLSPRTIEWHLRNVFTKLGVGSRMGLVDALPSRPRDAAPLVAVRTRD